MKIFGKIPAIDFSTITTSLNEDGGIWIYEPASSDVVAIEVEQAYLDTGHDGGGGNGS